MNITILAISTLIVLIVFGIPIATHPQWFKSVEEEIEEAKREGHIVTAKPVKIEHISKNRRDDIEEPHRYIVTYEYEYNGKTYKKVQRARKVSRKGNLHSEWKSQESVLFRGRPSDNTGTTCADFHAHRDCGTVLRNYKDHANVGHHPHRADWQ